MSDTTAQSAAEATGTTDTAQANAEQAQAAAVTVTSADLAHAAEGTATDNGQEPNQQTDNTELPEWARGKFAKANAEAVKYRTRVKEAEASKAAEGSSPLTRGTLV